MIQGGQADPGTTDGQAAHALQGGARLFKEVKLIQLLNFKRLTRLVLTNVGYMRKSRDVKKCKIKFKRTVLFSANIKSGQLCSKPLYFQPLSSQFSTVE